MLRIDIPHLCRLIAALTAFALLAGCASGDLPGGYASSERRAEQLRDEGRYADAARLYIGLASSAVGVERDRLTLLAIEQWLDAGDGRRAKTAMADVAVPGEGDLRWLWNLNRAALELWEGTPRQRAKYPRTDERTSHVARKTDASAGTARGCVVSKEDPLRAIGLYTELEQWLTTTPQVARNRQRLWAGLLVGNPQQLQSVAEITNDPVARGWLSLAALATATGQQGIGWSNGMARWREANSTHPALSVLGDVQIVDPSALDYPRQVALLLPLSGRNATAGRAVQNGFFGAYYGASLGLEEAQEVRVYDVVQSGGAPAAYSEALADGAQFVVGPLVRQQVNELAVQPTLPVPVLALNYAQDERRMPPGMFQFALAPEDEAAAAARRAVLDGRRRALALVPNNDWGRRLLASFANELTAQGGQLLEHRFYQPTDQDFSFEIRNLMGLALSRQRFERLRANIGGRLEFDPRRRSDAQFIFLAATAPVGRLIKSQLKFHFSGDVPVYSTSRIYAMDGRSDTDLNGVMFADTPWIIAPQPWIAGLQTTYAEYWPNERRMGRLHAMGYDAYLLVSELFSTRREGVLSVNGATGRLYLDDAGRIHRDLPWAQFQGGQPVFVPEPGNLGALPTDPTWPPTDLDERTGASVLAVPEP